MKNPIIIVAILVCVIFQSCDTRNLRLVEDGVTDYVIVIPENNEDILESTAIVLQKYIDKMSGVQIPLVKEDNTKDAYNKIYLQLLQEEKIQEQKIVIKTEGNDIYIKGGSPKAVENAVYEFLEKYLGYRWYAPRVEKNDPLKLINIEPIDYVYVSAITTRTVHSRLFYENKDYADQQKVTYNAFPNYIPKARVHTFHKFLPEENFYDTKPEYYALRGDKRLPTQLCLTNEAVLEIVKDSVSSLFKKYPEASVISVSQNDNQQFCQCDNCSKIDIEEGSQAGTMIHFVNKVAKAFPDKTISTLAYQYTRKPCKTKPASNVLITLCSIECDRSTSITQKCADFSNDLKGWGKLTSNIRIWDYTTQFTNFLAPFPNLHTLQPNIQLFRDNNARWVFEQHSNNPSELFELRSYITAKLLWNPDLNLDELLVDFTNGYYEEAGVYIKKYIDQIHDEIKKDDDFFLFLYGDPSEAFDSYLHPDLLSKYAHFFDKAEKAVADKPDVVNRVKRARIGIDYAILEACRKNSNMLYSLMVKDDLGQEISNPFVTSLLDSFIETCANNNITLMNEMGFKVSDYYANYLSALETSKKPNKAKGKQVNTITSPKKYANEDPMVLTDGALGGSSFYANWLGYENNDMEVIVDLGESVEIQTLSIAFLQVTNHIVFFPSSVEYYGSVDNINFMKLGIVDNPSPLTKSSKINDIQQYNLNFDSQKVRYIKIKAKNTETPYWHHAAGLPSWLFADEIIVN